MGIITSNFHRTWLIDICILVFELKLNVTQN